MENTNRIQAMGFFLLRTGIPAGRNLTGMEAFNLIRN